MQDYILDPTNYTTLPGVAWDAALEKADIELELLGDHKRLDIFERQKRGGLVFAGSKRHVEANNRDIEGYDNTKPENYLMYVDANNLYDHAMCQPFYHIQIFDFLMLI